MLQRWARHPRAGAFASERLYFHGNTIELKE